MITGMEVAACQNMAVPAEVMQHIVNVESGYNPYAIGVVGGQLVRQPQNLGEAIATAQMLESKGYNYSLGLAQVNRANLSKYGLTTYQQAFGICPNLTAGARILSECYVSSGNDWGKSFSCYYSGNFVTGYRDGYVQKIVDSINEAKALASVIGAQPAPIELVATPSVSTAPRNLALPSAAVDSASYRQAIRSTVLDTGATLAAKSIVPALLPTLTSTASATAPPLPSTNDVSANTNTPPQAVTPAPGGASPSGDIFEPQVRALGETTAAVSSTAAVAGKVPGQAMTTPSASNVDATNADRGGHDDALVF
jgi:type IV secretion system protein VirB1